MTFTLPFRNWAALLRRRVVRTHVRSALVILAIFGVLLAIGTHQGRDLASMLRFAMSQSASGGAEAKVARAQPLRALEPGASFVETRVGSLLFSTQNSDICRRVLFDNRTGELVETGRVHCIHPSESVEQFVHDRAQAMFRAFRR